MRCPGCSSENLPIRETSSVVGSKIEHPRYCGECGHELTEKCPVCTYHHVIGTKFCQANRANIEAWLNEESAWKALVQTLSATLDVRPATEWFWYIVAILPSTLLTSWWLSLAIEDLFGYGSFAGYLFIGFVGLLWWAVVSLVSLLFVTAIMVAVERSRRRKLFGEQSYQVLNPENRVLDVEA